MSSDMRVATLGSSSRGLLGQTVDEGGPGHAVLLLPCPIADGDRSSLDLAVTQDEHVLNLLLLSQPDLVLHAAIRAVDLHPKPARLDQLRQLVCAGGMAIRYRDDHHLDGRTPDREGAGEVLDHDSDETLQRTVDGPVDSHRPNGLAVLVDVRAIEPLGQHDQVDLDRRRLPFAPERVLDLDVDLGGVEGAVLRLEAVGLAERVEGGLDLGLGLFPQRRVTKRLVGLGSEGEPRLEAEPAVNLVHLAQQSLDLVLELVRAEVDMGIVRDEVADAGQARQRAGAFVAMQPPEVGEAERQVAIGPQLALVYERALRAVHRLEAEGLALGLEYEHAVLVVGPVARLLPQLLVDEHGRRDFLVAAPVLDLADRGLEGTPQALTLGMPKGRAGADVVEAEQIQLNAETAMVAALGFLAAVKVAVQLFLRGPDRAVDALEHRPFLRAAPVGARDGHQLERADRPGAGHVRTLAQVGKLAVFIGGSGRQGRVRVSGARGQVVENLDLERLIASLAVGATLLERELLSLIHI